MPTVLRKDGYRVVIYPNDHAPPHVHVIHADGEARIDLVDGPRLLTVAGLNPMQARRAVSLVSANLDACVDRWREIHG